MFSPLLIVALHSYKDICVFGPSARLRGSESCKYRKNPAQHCYSVTLLEIERKEGEKRRGSYPGKKGKTHLPTRQMFMRILIHLKSSLFITYFIQ